jgi:hypothetical protein
MMCDIQVISSSIIEVEVFRSQVLITRRARASFEKNSGYTKIKIEGLPVSLHDDSFRIQLSDASLCRVVDSHIQWDIGDRTSDFQTQLSRELQLLLLEEQRIKAKLNVLQDRIRFMESMEISRTGEVNLPEGIAFSERHQFPDWLKCSEWVREEYLAQSRVYRDLEKTKKSVDDKIHKVRDQLRRESLALKEKSSRMHKAAILTFEHDAEFNHIDLDISYLVSGAGWVPEYDFFFNAASDMAELGLKALVAQKTGEDWPAVSMGFSTSDLQRSTSLPKLDSWKIGKTQPPVNTGWRELPPNLEELFLSYDQGLGDTEVPRLNPLPALPLIPDSGFGTGDSPGLIDSPLPKAGTLKARSGLTRSPVDDYSDTVEAERAIQFDNVDEDSFVSEAMPLGSPPSSSALKTRRIHRPGRKLKKTSSPLLAKAMMNSPTEAEESVAVSPDSRALNYTLLRMEGPGRREARGQLKLQSMRSQLEELFDRSGSLPRDVSSFLTKGKRFSWGRIKLPEYAVRLEQSVGHFASRYVMDGTAEVPSDGQLHSVSLMKRSVPLKKIYRAFPVENDQVYRMAVLENPMGLPLLSGPARIYYNGDFMTTVPLPTTAPGETLTLSLGIEEGITVARNVHFEERTEGLLNGDTVLDHRIEIEVHSAMTTAVDVEVFERVPVTEDKDVEVEILQTVPGAEKYDQTERRKLIRGGLKFRLTLEPRETQTCILSYRMTFSSKRVLEGGNHRA